MAFDERNEQRLALQMDKAPDPLAAQIEREFSEAKIARRSQEDVFLLAHTNTRGVYGADIAASNTKGSKAFVQITRPRVQTAFATLFPIIMPPGETCWTISATPEPRMPEVYRRALAEGATPEQAAAAVRAAAEKAADRLSIKVSDGLTEAKFPVKLSSALLEGVMFGTTIMAGPFVKECEKEGEVYYEPVIEWKSIWDVYPDPTARTVEDCNYIIERRLMSLPQFRDLRNTDAHPGFITSAIDEVLERYTDKGNWVPETWENEQAQSNAKNTGVQGYGRYQALIRWGYLSGRDLRGCGCTVDDSLLDTQIMAQVWSVGGKVIYAANSTFHRDRLPFYFAPYTQSSLSIWGVGVPEMMRDSQDAINACERSKMDNMALASRPMALVYPHLLAPGAGPLEVTAGRIFVAQASELSGGPKPVEIFTPEVRLDQIERVQQDHFQFVQEQTFLPNLLSGQGGEGVHNRTSSGAAMQFNAAVTPMKSVVFNYENFLIIPLIEKMAAFYREYDADPSLQGDMVVSAKGLSGLMHRDAMVSSLLNYLQIVGTVPGWSEQIDVERVGNLVVRYKGLTGENITLSPEEQAARREKMQQEQSVAQMANAQAQQQLQMKERAETGPKDAILQLMKEAPDGSPLKLALMRQALDMYGIQNESINEALEQQSELYGFDMEATAAEHGARVAEATYQPDEVGGVEDE